MTADSTVDRAPQEHSSLKKAAHTVLRMQLKTGGRGNGTVPVLHDLLVI